MQGRNSPSRLTFCNEEIMRVANCQYQEKRVHGLWVVFGAIVRAESKSEDGKIDAVKYE